jgi:hypothetical protein
VQALLDRPHAVEEKRTAAHTTLVLHEVTAAGPRGRGRPKNTIELMRDGELTVAGRAYQRITRIELARPPAWSGEPYLVGNAQWINTVEGTTRGRKLLSTFVRGKETLTKLGKRWYKENPEEYIIHVPVQITYVRKDKSHYTAPPSTLPIEWRTNIHESENRAKGAMFEHIQSKLPDHYTTQSIYQMKVLYDVDPRDWQLTRKRVIIDPPRTSTLKSETKKSSPRQESCLCFHVNKVYKN